MQEEKAIALLLQGGLIAGGLPDGRILVWAADSLLSPAGGQAEAIDITSTGQRSSNAPRIGGAVSHSPFPSMKPVIHE